MQADALQPISNDEDDNECQRPLSAKPDAEPSSLSSSVDQFSSELLEETVQFLRLQVGCCSFAIGVFSFLWLTIFVSSVFPPIGARSASSRPFVSSRQARVLLLVWGRV